MRVLIHKVIRITLLLALFYPGILLSDFMVTRPHGQLASALIASGVLIAFFVIADRVLPTSKHVVEARRRRKNIRYDNTSTIQGEF